MNHYGIMREAAENIVDNIFAEVDLNHNGKLDFTEFIVASMDQHLLLS